MDASAIGSWTLAATIRLPLTTTAKSCSGLLGQNTDSKSRAEMMESMGTPVRVNSPSGTPRSMTMSAPNWFRLRNSTASSTAGTISVKRRLPPASQRDWPMRMSACRNSG